MRQKTLRRFPFAAVGVVLIVVSVAPTIIGMVRGFDQLQQGVDATAVSGGVEATFHPAFVACGLIGVLLVIVGIVRAHHRGGRAVT